MNKRFVEYTQKRWEQQNVVFPQPVNKNLYTKKMQNHQTYGSLPITSTDKISFNNFFGIRIKNVSSNVDVVYVQLYNVRKLISRFYLAPNVLFLGSKVFLFLITKLLIRILCQQVNNSNSFKWDRWLISCNTVPTAHEFFFVHLFSVQQIKF